MRAGLPVIATDTGGVAEAVIDGVTGYVSAPGNAAQLRDRIQRLINSRDLITSMGAAGRLRYEQDFGIDTMVNKTVAVYREVVGARQGALVPGSVEA